MALVVVRCSCGCVYRREEHSEKVCPSCGKLNETGQGLAEGVSPSALRSLLVLAFSLLGGLLLVLGALLVRKLRPDPPSLSRPDPSAARIAPRPIKESPPPLPEPPPSGPLPAPVSLSVEVDELETPEIARAHRLAARGNLAALVKALLSLADAPEALARLQASLLAEHEELQDILRRHPRRPELAELPTRVEPNDVLLGFSVTALDPRNPEPFVRDVRAWFRTLQPGAATLVSVRRGERVLTFPIYAPTLADDISSLLRLAGTLPGAGGVGDERLERPLPAVLLEEVLQRLEALHPVYRDALPAEVRDRIELLLRRAAGGEDDERFLRSVVLDRTFRPLEEEYAGLLRLSLQHEEQAMSLLRPDVIRFADGRRLEVLILEEKTESLLIRARVGEAKLDRKDVVSIDRGQPLARNVQTRYAERRDDIPGLLALLPSLRAERFKPLRDMVCARVLVLDPEHETAWAELGLARRRPPPDARERDVVVLKDGSRRTGLIVEESADGLLLEAPLPGPRGEPLGRARSRVGRAEILRVDRMSEEARERAKERAAALEESRRAVEKAIAAYASAPLEIGGQRGLSIETPLFELRSTAPEREARETAHALETLFAAARRELGGRRDEGRRIVVHLLADRAAAEAFRKAAGGAAPIVTYDAGQSEEARRAREAARSAEEELERHRAALAAEEARVAERLKSADGSRARALREGLAAFRKEAIRGMEALRASARRQEALAAARSAEARAALFHETFRAFAADARPAWLREGFAAYFETAVVDAGELRHGAPPRRHLDLLRERLQAGTPLSIQTVFRAGADALAQDPGMAAQAWLAAHWLASRGFDREGLERYAAATSRGDDPAAAFERVSGLSGPGLEAALLLHLRRLAETSR